MAALMHRGGVIVLALASLVSIARAQPAAPTNLVVSDAGAGVASLRWVSNSGAGTTFEVERTPAFATPPTLAPDVVTLRDEAGNGRFSYRVRARVGSQTSAFTGWAAVDITSGNAATPPSQGGGAAEGWTVPVRSADTKVYYVSASDGNDANHGLTSDSPLRTIAAGYAKLRHGSPDWLLLKRGDTFNEGLGHWRKSGRSAAEPMVVSTYGSDPRRPLLRTGTEPGFKRTGGNSSPSSIDNVWVMGLEMTPVGRTPDQIVQGIWWLGAGSNILFEDLYVHDYKLGASFEGEGVGASNIKLRRSIIADNFGEEPGHSQGIYGYNVRDLTLEENVIDHNGWSRDGLHLPTVFNHNIYLHGRVYNTTIRGNIITYASSHGISMNMDGLIEDNYVSQNCISMFVRTAPVVVRRNVIIEPRDLSASTILGFGIDLGPVFTDIPPPLPAPGPALIEENILAHNRAAGQGSAITAHSNTLPNNTTTTIRRNTVYDWGGNHVTISAPWTDTLRVEANTLVVPNGSPMFPLIEHRPNPVDTTIATYLSNQYWSVFPTNRWLRIGESRWVALADWKNQTRESGHTVTAISFADPNRTAATYNATLGGSATLDAFLVEAKKQSRFNWRPPYTAQALNDYVRAGFARQ